MGLNAVCEGIYKRGSHNGLGLIRCNKLERFMKTFITLSLFLSFSSFAAFDSDDLATLITESEKKDSDVLMVWKDGTLLYSRNTDFNKKYSIQSVTKSLTALTTLCILKDTSRKLDDPNLFKEWEGTTKEQITLRHLLSMTSGIIDPTDPWGDHDYYQHAADQPLTTTPGTTFSYANVSPMITGKWIKESTGEQFSVHINRCFFETMGITDWKIGKDGERNEVVAGGIKILAQDLLKIGVMLVQNGIYEGKELLTSEDVQSLSTDPLNDRNPYGLGFWRRGKEMYYAEGYLGQFIIMVPKENLVVLRIRNRDFMRGTENNKINWFKELPGLISQLIK